MTFEPSSESNEHYTPPAIVEAARATMGEIDLDPASCAEANECVRAAVIYGRGSGGLPRGGLDLSWRDPWGCCFGEGPQPWHPPRVFLNPPGGKIGKRSSAVVWWEKLIGQWLSGNVEQAIFVCFNLEVLNTTQACETMCLEFPICYFKSRPRFWPPGTPPELRGKTGAPKYPGAVVYVPRWDAVRECAPLLYDAGVQRFVKNFSPLGKVVVPA